MKRISLWLLVFTLAVGSVRAQDAATQQQIDKLNGQIQDLQETVAQQGKLIDTLNKRISELGDKVNTPAVNDSASTDDLKKLAAQVQEIDQKRQDDRDLILKEIKKLGAGGAIAPPSHRNSASSKPPADATTDTAPAIPQKGYDYVVQPGDSLGAIMKAYRDKGVKVTMSQLIAANPKMNPNVLIPGKKIFIPDASAK